MVNIKKIIITDATPLILMAKVGLLDLISDQFVIIITNEVAHEATCRTDLPDAQYIKNLIDEKKILIKNVPVKSVKEFQKKWGIGKGESSILVLASKEKSVIVTDDLAAMRVARILKIPFVTSLLLLIELHKNGLLSLDSARVKIHALEEFGWFGTEVLHEAKKLLEGGK